MSDVVEKEIRTDTKGMLLCKAVQKENGDYDLIKKDGRKEDSLSVNSFLSQVFGKPVTILIN